jgi:hypothetical protein
MFPVTQCLGLGEPDRAACFARSTLANVKIPMSRKSCETWGTPLY